MSGQSACALAREKRLRFEDKRIDVPVAHSPLHDTIVRDHPEPPRRGGPPESPLRNEVGSAHVTGEKRGDDSQTVTLRGVRHDHEKLETAIVHRSRLWLEVLPQQEEADELAATGFGERSEEHTSELQS